MRLDAAPAGASALETMIEALQAPGLTPAIRSRVDGPAALAVLDFSNRCPNPAWEALPTDQRGVWLAGDLRLDRPRALASTLGLSEKAAADDLALAALARWSADVPDHLDGDFALAGWDPRRRRLLLARDIAGARPLCYTHRPGRFFAFASLPRGLHDSGITAPEPDLVALGRILVEVYPVSTATGYRDISWLKPGHSLAVTPGDFRLHRAWRPDESDVGRWRGTAEDAAAKMRDLIQEAVASRVPADGAIASDLSGGLDSSAISVLAARTARQRGGRLISISQLARSGCGEDLTDEREFVDAVLEQEPDIQWSAIHLPSLATDHSDSDLPGGIPGAWLTDAASRVAAASGVSLILGGLGGDEGATCNAAGLHAAMLLDGAWRRLPRELALWAMRQGQSLRRAAVTRVAGPLLADRLFRIADLVRGRRRTAGKRALLALLNPAIARQLETELPTARELYHRPTERIRRVADSYLCTRATNWSVQAARYGVAYSFPLLDRRLIDFVLSLPVERFVRDGWTRQPFRQAMAGILPEKIRWREVKYVPFPDAPLMFAEAKERMGADFAAIRGNSAAAALLDMRALETAIGAIPGREEALAAARRMNRTDGTPGDSVRHLAAFRALRMAERLARSGGNEA
jgi:asparagine synthase (glutamine-hydrolysing)